MDTDRAIETAQWDLFEVRLSGPKVGNPFKEVTLTGAFSSGNRIVEVDGFYDDDGSYVVRFMPDSLGEWRFVTRSNSPELDGRSGAFTCTAPGAGNHGPVRVRDAAAFAYEDGTRYTAVGTTCYVWNHQAGTRQEETLASLSRSPFNKIRMCVFPKHYDYNHNEPEFFAFPGSLAGGFDLARFDVAFFRHLENRIAQLRDLGIQADIILFHPYDRWGFSKMPAEVDDFYLQYVIARLSAYRNVWWSMANEYDLMESKTLLDWDRLFRVTQASDPYQHLRSIHNCWQFYDHSKPWVTHCSIQRWDLSLVSQWSEQYHKPVVVDECGYEGSIEHRWGNLTPQEMTSRFWEGFTRGGYVGHGETYNRDGVLWWSHGGSLHGESPKRIEFLRRVLEEVPEPGLRSIRWPRVDFACGAVGERYYLFYFAGAQPALRPLSLPQGKRYRATVIDTWNMTMTPLEGSYGGECTIPLPAKPYIALRLVEE